MPDLVAALGNKDWALRHAAAGALGRIGGGRAEKALLAALNDQSHPVRDEIGDALERIAPHWRKRPAAQAAVRAHVADLQAPGAPQRVAAARRLGELGDSWTVQPLIQALTDRDGNVRKTAAWALGRLRAEQAVAPLIEALKDRNYYVRSEAGSPPCPLFRARESLAELRDGGRLVRQACGGHRGWAVRKVPAWPIRKATARHMPSAGSTWEYSAMRWADTRDPGTDDAYPRGFTMPQWYCRIDGKQHGPMATAELSALAKAGRVQPADLIRREDMTDWVEAGRAKGLFDVPVASLAEEMPEGSMPPAAEADDAATPADSPTDRNTPAGRPASPKRRRVLVVSLAGVVLVAAVVGGILWMNRTDKTDRPGDSPSPDGTEGRQGLSWPAGAGYVTPPKNRPDTPHNIRETISRAEIVAVNGRTLRFSKNSRVEYRASKSMAFAPGAQITYLCQSPPTLEWPDYNGDKCILSYGLTVRVDEYGQFVPVSVHTPAPHVSGDLKAKTIQVNNTNPHGGFWCRKARRPLPAAARADVVKILTAYLAYLKTRKPSGKYTTVKMGEAFEVTDGTRTYRAQTASSIAGMVAEGKLVRLAPVVHITLLNEWRLSNQNTLPAGTAIYTESLGGPWSAARPMPLGKNALHGLKARTAEPRPSDRLEKRVRLEVNSSRLSDEAWGNSYRILAAYLATQLPSDRSKTYASVKSGALFEVTDGKRTYRGRVGGLAGNVHKNGHTSFNFLGITTLNDWVLPDGTRLPAQTSLSSRTPHKGLYVRRPLAAPRPKPALPAKEDAWRTDIGAFTRKVAEVAGRSHIPDRRQLLDSLRSRKVFTNSAGKPIVVVLEPLLDGELHGELAKAFSGTISWSGRVETIKRAKDGKTYEVEIAWPVPKDLPKNVQLRSMLRMKVSAGVLEAAGVPKKGQTFAFTGELKKDKPDGFQPVWVLYSPDVGKDKHLIGATPIHVKPSR